MKAILQSLLEAVAVILLVPQLFVFLYFFWPTIHGYDGRGMITSLIVFGFSISRIAGPFLYILFLVITALNRDKRRHVASFLICTCSGYAAVVAWNVFIFENFSYAWGLLPVLLCSAGVSAYQFLRDTSIMAPPPPELFLSSDA
jgi:hypothetical protein